MMDAAVGAAATIATGSGTSLRPGSWCTYNNTFFYRNGGTTLRQWDGSSASVANVSSMTKIDFVYT
jgi:hypothetical protein